MMAVISSVQNDFVKMARSLKDKKGRRMYNAFLVEGEKCVGELLAFAPQLLKALIVTGDYRGEALDRIDRNESRVYTMDGRVMKAVCDCMTPQNIAAVAAVPAPDVIDSGFIVALDDVQDPSNVGTIIRTADAAGCSGVVLSPGSADCYSPKAVRASMGSIFHIPVIRTDLPVYLTGLLSKGHRVACAELKGDTRFALDADKTCLVIGNEARGISEEIMALASARIRIPIYGKAESLNAAVAAGILIYKIRS